jgi:hypothetical protein
MISNSKKADGVARARQTPRLRPTNHNMKKEYFIFRQLPGIYKE